jgi:DNA polymerase II small subunit
MTFNLQFPKSRRYWRSNLIYDTMDNASDDQKKNIIDFFLARNIVLGPDFFSTETRSSEELFSLVRTKIDTSSFIYFNSQILESLSSPQQENSNRLELEKTKAMQGKNSQKTDFADSTKPLQPAKPAIDDAPLKILYCYQEQAKKWQMSDFVSMFTRRYQVIEAMLKTRQELQNLTSISKIAHKHEKENVSLIGMVVDKQTTKNNNFMITVEDMTGSIKLLITKNNQELYDSAKNIVLDEVIGVSGMNGENILFVSSIIWPDIPISKELKKSPDEIYSVFLSDIHVGSKYFLEENFLRFLKWISGSFGTPEQRAVTDKIRYLFIIGDLIDGCGIYPEQDKELLIKDIYQQYEVCAKYLSQIPPRIKIIIIPGNHDAMRISEPQPPLYKDFAKPIWELPNVVLLSNPSIVNICASENFPGFDILLYHGYSFDYYVANIDTIRNQGGYDRADLIMKFLLQKRHLAPTHKSTLYIPETKNDPLVIEKVPDFFVTGHIHKTSVSHYRNITLISGSCWQSKTAFQEKVGHNPEPCRVPIVNLQTRAVKVLKF